MSDHDINDRFNAATLALSRAREAAQRGVQPDAIVERAVIGSGRAVVRGGYMEDGLRMYHVAVGTLGAAARDYDGWLEIA